MSRAAAPPAPWREWAFRIGVGPVALLHGLLSLRSALDPALARLGDRATSRLEDMAAFADAPDRWRQVVEHGAPGDYAIHALLHMLGGLPLLLAVQLVAFLATLYWLYDLARRLSAPPWAAGTAVTAFALLPSNLHQPHTVVTEALVNPLVAWWTREGVIALRAGALSTGRLMTMAVAIGTAALIRPVVVPALPALALVLAHRGIVRGRRLLLLHGVALLPLAALLLATAVSGEDATLGGRRASLGANLFRRMKRIEQLSGQPLPAHVHYRASVGQYLAYGLSEPVAFARLHVTDTLLLTANTGVNHTFGRFLGLFPMQEGTHYWTPLIEERGVLAAALELLRREPARLLANAVVGVLWLGFGLVAVAGAVRALRDPRRRIPALAIGVVALATVVGAYASHYARWSQRSPAEFGLAALFAVGLAEIAATRARGRGGGRPTGPKAR